MSYQLDLSNTATKEIKAFKKSGNKILLIKLNKLLLEIIEHPYSGTGKPEQLKHELSGYWSRRINKEHRIIYEVLKEKNKNHCIIYKRTLSVKYTATYLI